MARRISAGPRRDGEFEYYEAMTHFAGSGAFDVNPAVAGVQPETNGDTYNGSVWELARAIYFSAAGDTLEPTPEEMAAALDYYAEHAITAGYSWSWVGNPLEQRVFDDLIHRSDDAARGATTMLGIVLANHVVSAVDALLTARLRDDGEGGGGGVDEGVEIRFFPWNPVREPGRVGVRVRLPVP